MRTTASNLLVLTGVGLVLYGVGQLSVPAALVIAGATVFVAGINLVRGR